MRNYKSKIIVGIVVAVILAFVFCLSTNPDKDDITNINEEQTETLSSSALNDAIIESEEKSEEKSAEEQRSNDIIPKRPEPKTEENTYKTEPVSECKPVPIEPENAVISDKELTCTLSVRCDTILENIELFDNEKLELVPKDGIIYAQQTVTFYEGESVFNLLVREMKRNKIHLEFENTPIYNSAYIEAIANLYEFDCGELSGWMYKVNDWFPNYGCSRYQLKDGDKVEWVYTCDLGRDIGGNYSARNGKE